MHIDDLDALLEKYRDDRCTPEEKRIVEEWYESLGGAPPGEPDISASLEKVSHRLEATLAERNTPRRISWRWMAAAAAALLLAPLAWRAICLRNCPEAVTIETAAAEMRLDTLPDGTVVQLNANSRLVYKDREARLEKGEAYFQVAPDAEKPFSVVTGTLTTTVLGTSFDIRSYDRDSVTMVALMSGKVRVGNILLSPHEYLTYRKTTGQADTTHFDNEDDVTAWRQGALNFKDATFEDIAFSLANLYNIHLENRSSKRRWSYTGYFGREAVGEILWTICVTEHLQYHSVGNRIILIDKK
jgi:transmembrane sensor